MEKEQALTGKIALEESQSEGLDFPEQSAHNHLHKSKNQRKVSLAQKEVWFAS